MLLKTLLSMFAFTSPQQDLEKIDFFNRLGDNSQCNCIISACENGKAKQLAFCLKNTRVDFDAEDAQNLRALGDAHKNEQTRANLNAVLDEYMPSVLPNMQVSKDMCGSDDN